MSNVMRNLFTTLCLPVIHGCAQTPLPPPFVCLTGPGWKFLEQAPENADDLYKLVGQRFNLVKFPTKTHDYWSESANGELRLCRQRVDAQDFCGSLNVTFTTSANTPRPASIGIPTSTSATFITTANTPQLRALMTVPTCGVLD
jgi:hypothetical protein